MGQTIISAIGVYISTSIDYLIVLIILFAQLSQNKQKWHIYAGQYLGTGLLVGASLVAAYVVNFVPEAWMVGLLGLIPIYLGIRFAIVGEGEEEEEEEIIERLEQSKANQLFWTVTLLTIASGGDNLGIYIPYFASLDWSQTLVVLLVFAIGIIIFCELSWVLSSIPLISETIEKYQRIIVPLVFIPLGLYIMYESGTIETFLNFIL
ncbi:Cad superfamily protein [Streptococcus dysgalactiae subsp. equisimilis]|jgi:cadmium resistance transporter (or sequestration) family protein|uniref:Cadmium resistance transporter, putative n=1 Tax=Streptococcus agalactiae serotype V (strain ATCC BAA-611 / 2603 V/R) TaxID=208435 RepID=Q8DZ55_STRA5|nr:MULTISPECIES: CadD family cadmium resistance transporter [Streptococcus]EAO78154.1 cadmium resistance protein [Streptococcus agalactiae H36B]AAN00138.1 cadmium resistance transporter, putative [Streptococcus agalactiae 2603V/R]EPT55675.1 cadmium resistance protein CadD [Streptococcus agalactiae CCUG 25532]EPT88456.1 cadmium resistance protein CadD [Streptococcus agalactiae BSU247]EPT95570.1 cadmium resistance protein CadD [Streptococcus agalactiae BSU188]